MNVIKSENTTLTETPVRRSSEAATNQSLYGHLIPRSLTERDPLGAQTYAEDLFHYPPEVLELLTEFQRLVRGMLEDSPLPQKTLLNAVGGFNTGTLGIFLSKEEKTKFMSWVEGIPKFFHPYFSKVCTTLGQKLYVEDALNTPGGIIKPERLRHLILPRTVAALPEMDDGFAIQLVYFIENTIGVDLQAAYLGENLNTVIRPLIRALREAGFQPPHDPTFQPSYMSMLACIINSPGYSRIMELEPNELVRIFNGLFMLFNDVLADFEHLDGHTARKMAASYIRSVIGRLERYHDLDPSQLEHVI